MKNEEQILYIMQNGRRAEYKIGITDNLNRRRKQLQTGCPQELRIIKVWTHYNRKMILYYEKVIHHYFDHKKIRANGEWYKLNAVDLAELCQPNSIEEQDELIEQYADLI